MRSIRRLIQSRAGEQRGVRLAACAISTCPFPAPPSPSPILALAALPVPVPHLHYTWSPRLS
jgi:hypothetical protein